jgi:hypothetical protein
LRFGDLHLTHLCLNLYPTCSPHLSISAIRQSRRRNVEPQVRTDKILRQAVTGKIDSRQRQESRFVALRSGTPKPLGRHDTILTNDRAVGIHRAENELALCVSLFSPTLHIGQERLLS